MPITTTMGIHEIDIDISYVCLQHPINDVNDEIFVSKFVYDNINTRQEIQFKGIREVQ
jgi:hypothetical protein